MSLIDFFPKKASVGYIAYKEKSGEAPKRYYMLDNSMVSNFKRGDTLVSDVTYYPPFDETVVYLTNQTIQAPNGLLYTTVREVDASTHKPWENYIPAGKTSPDWEVSGYASEFDSVSCGTFENRIYSNVDEQLSFEVDLSQIQGGRSSVKDCSLQGLLKTLETSQSG